MAVVPTHPKDSESRTVNPMRQYAIKATFDSHAGRAAEAYLLVASSRNLAIARARQIAMASEFLVAAPSCCTVALRVLPSTGRARERIQQKETP